MTQTRNAQTLPWHRWCRLLLRQLWQGEQAAWQAVPGDGTGVVIMNQVTEDQSKMLLDKVGGASGPLYGGFFSKFGVPAKGKEEVNFDEFIEMMEAGVAIIEKRGKAVVGDKTMVDTLRPAVDALKTAYVDEKMAPKEAMKKALEVGEAGSDATIPIIAKKGRAMRLGERAIGHRDPGSASSAAILAILYNRMP